MKRKEVIETFKSCNMQRC